MRLPNRYEAEFARLLEAVAVATPDAGAPIAPFWPLRGRQYQSELLVIGRSVNGWIDDWKVGQLRDASIRRKAAARMRLDAEPEDFDRMQWVEDLWGAPDGYNTARSAFWRVLRRLISDNGQRGWAGRLVWTNPRRHQRPAGTPEPTFSERNEGTPSTSLRWNWMYSRRAVYSR